MLEELELVFLSEILLLRSKKTSLCYLPLCFIGSHHKTVVFQVLGYFYLNTFFFSSFLVYTSVLVPGL